MLESRDISTLRFGRLRSSGIAHDMVWYCTSENTAVTSGCALNVSWTSDGLIWYDSPRMS